MKKIIVSAAVALAAIGFAFAEGSAWDVNGYFRAGVEGNTDAKDAETKVYKDGFYYGNGKSRARLNVNFTQEDYGFKFRYQADGFGLNNADTVTTTTSVKKDGNEVGSFTTTSTKETWFTQDNLKYMFGYAKFYDGKIITEAGKLQDFYTQSEARYEYQAIGGYGARLVTTNKEGLFASVALSTYRAEKFAAGDDEVKDGKAKAGDIKFNSKLITVSSKYKNENYALASGYNFAGELYAYFALTAIPNLKFNIEGKHIDKDISGVYEDGKKGGEKTDKIEVYELVNYNFKGVGTPLEVGVYFHQVIVKGDNVFEFYPHLSYAINDVITPQFEVGIFKYANKDNHLDRDGEGQSISYNVTPSVKFTAGKKATVKVYYNYDKNDKHAVGTTLRVNY